MRKVEQEAIRQARLLMLAAKEGASLQADGGKHVDALSSMFGTTTTKASQDMARLDTMDSSSDEENDEGQDDSGDAEELEEAG